jgi:hypothetical protein
MAVYVLIFVFIIFFLFYFFRYKPITESATTSQNIANNAYVTNIDTQLDDLINKIKTVQDTYQNLNTVLQFDIVEENSDPTADPEIYITGKPPKQIIHLKLPKGLKGPLGCQGPKGNVGTPGGRGDLGNQGATGLNVTPSLIGNKPLTSIE